MEVLYIPDIQKELFSVFGDVEKRASGNNQTFKTPRGRTDVARMWQSHWLNVRESN